MNLLRYLILAYEYQEDIRIEIISYWRLTILAYTIFLFCYDLLLELVYLWVTCFPSNRSTCHVLILTPFIVSCIVTSRTVIFETQALVWSFPRLPMLIPCPGPQFTLCMYTFEHPVWMETQSSPEMIRLNIISHMFSSTSNFYLKIFSCAMLIIHTTVVICFSY